MFVSKMNLRWTAERHVSLIFCLFSSSLCQCDLGPVLFCWVVSKSQKFSTKIICWQSFWFSKGQTERETGLCSLVFVSSDFVWVKRKEFSFSCAFFFFFCPFYMGKEENAEASSMIWCYYGAKKFKQYWLEIKIDGVIFSVFWTLFLKKFNKGLILLLC